MTNREIAYGLMVSDAGHDSTVDRVTLALETMGWLKAEENKR